MMSETLRQLAYQSPLLLVYLIGLILSLILIRHAPKPAFMAAGACAVLLFTTLAASIAGALIFNTRMAGGISFETFSWISSIINVLSACIRAAAVGLLLAAVFVGRSGPGPASNFPVIPNSR